MGKIKVLSMNLENEFNKIDNQLKTLKEKTSNKSKHPYVNIKKYSPLDKAIEEYKRGLEDFKKAISSFEKDISEEIEKRKGILKQIIEEDRIQKSLDEHFTVSREFDYKNLQALLSEGEIRYRNKIPPGYEDNEKTGVQKYGDLIIWKQILELAKNKKQDFIFVTNDTKEDWFEEKGSLPRFELLREFNSITHKRLWLMTMQKFTFHTNQLLENQIKENALDEVVAIQKEQWLTLQDIDLAVAIRGFFEKDLDMKNVKVSSMASPEGARIFDNPSILKVETEEKQYVAICTLMNGGNYARILHGMTNAFEIRKCLSDSKIVYYNFIIIRQGNEGRILEHLEKTKVRKLFADNSITTIIAYIDSGKIRLFKTNNNRTLGVQGMLMVLNTLTESLTEIKEQYNL